jgi:hypothetical protein
MSAPQEEYLDLVVGDDGTVKVHVSADELARLGARPGDHLRLVRGGPPSQPRARKKVRGILIGKIAPEELLTEEDFAAARRDRDQIAKRKYGALE